MKTVKAPALFLRPTPEQRAIIDEAHVEFGGEESLNQFCLGMLLDQISARRNAETMERNAETMERISLKQDSLTDSSLSQRSVVS
jgi:hypothetical protein